MSSALILKGLLAFSLLVSYGCPALPPSQRAAEEMLSVARMGLAQVENGPDHVIIAGPNLGPSARQSLAQLRKVIESADVPQSADYTLPPGYLIVEQLDVTGSQAIFAAHVGPIPRAKPGEILLSCGTRYTISMKRESNGAWKVESVSVGVC